MSQTLTRKYPATPEQVWELWTTPEGIEQWWSPDGFETDVRELDLRPGGVLIHAMTATAPEMVSFMEQSGMPLTNVARKTFTEVDEPARLAYTSLVDFVPGHEPYEHLTVVQIEREGDGVVVTMSIEPMHDEEWTQRMVAGRENELENLGRLLGANVA